MSEAILTLTLPQRVEWGPGAVTRVADAVNALGATRVFVVAMRDAAVAAAGHVERLLAVLPPAVRTTVYDGVEPEPTVAAVGGNNMKAPLMSGLRVKKKFMPLTDSWHFHSAEDSTTGEISRL